MSWTDDVPPRVLTLPREGRLLICTDLHGNLRDFRRISRLFVDALERHGSCHLLFTGDLIHGPNFSKKHWPEHLGTFYQDRSGRLLDELIQLQRSFPGLVHSLIGNHEHSHVGGPHTPKFWPDETVHFERSVGRRRAQRYRTFLGQLPVMALTECGVAVTHAAPNVEVTRRDEVAQLSYDGYEDMAVETPLSIPLLGRLLWSRDCPESVAQEFLRVMGVGQETLNLVIYGHEIVTEGYHRRDLGQLQLSTSFGVKDDDKHYVELDLSASYGSTHDLRPGRELRLLYE